MPSASRIAILHDDNGIADKVVRFAAVAELSVVRADSIARLEALLCDRLITAVVLDLIGPSSGGFELVERVAQSPCQPVVVVVTALDAKTVDSIRRLGSTKGLKLRVFRHIIDDAALKTCITQLEKRGTDFSATDLDEAIENGYLRVEYQPKVPLGVGAPPACAVEALCRISHPRFGNVYPDRFIAIAEKEGLIGKLTDAVARQAFADWCVWRKCGLLAKLALNISPELLKDNAWCELFLQRCQEFDIDPERITLEITESSSGAAHAAALDVLTRLRCKGFTLSIDDFGTGFSSLAALYKLPFGELKIDKSFTFDLKDSLEARALIESTIGMAQRLGLKVVAEGVETEEVFRELRRMGCQDAQGYFISRSIPADKIPPFFAEWRSVAESEPVSAVPAIPVPKIAMIQALLADILNDPADRSSAPLADYGDGERQAGEPDALEAARKIPPLVLKGSLMAALAHCHTVLRRLDARQDRTIFRTKVLELKTLIEGDLLCREDLELKAPTGRVHLLHKPSVLIGRPSSARAVDIAIGCRWFSRGDKNLRLFQRGDDWLIEDLGSTNGSFIGGEALKPGVPFALGLGETLVEIGRRGGRPAPVAVRLRRANATPQAIAMTLAAEGAPLAGGEWPSLTEDIRTTWIVFREKASIGSSFDCTLVLEAAAARHAADIVFRDGYRIRPTAGGRLVLLGTPFDEETPLPVPGQVTVGDVTLEVDRRAADEARAGATPIERPNAMGA